MSTNKQFKVPIFSFFEPKNYKTAYFFIILALTIVAYNMSPNPNDGVSDDLKYLKEVEILQEKGIFEGFQELAQNFLGKYVDREITSHPSGSSQPFRVVHILSHYAFFKIEPSVFSGTYLSLLFYFLLGLLMFWFLSRYWPIEQAFLVAVMSMTAPLLLGYSARALTETQYYFFMLLNLFCFLNFIHQPNDKQLKYFILATILNVGFKEIAVLFFPFFVMGSIAAKYLYNPKITLKQLILIALVPVLTLTIVYFLLLGFQNMCDIIYIQLNRHIFLERVDYHQRTGDGPWFQYFVDFLTLSPIVSILCFFGIGYYLFRKKTFTINHQSINQLIFLIYFLYAILALSLLIKNARYAIFLDFFYRFFAVFFILIVAQTFFRKAKYQLVCIILFSVLSIGADLYKYNRFFVKKRSLMVINKKLLEAEQFFSGSHRTRVFNKQASNYFNQLALKNLKKKNYVASKAYLDMANKYEEKSIMTNYLFCEMNFTEKKFDEAKKYCQSTINLDITVGKEAAIAREKQQQAKNILQQIKQVQQK